MADPPGQAGRPPPLDVGAEDVTAHPHHTGTRWFDLAMAMTAILISTVSLVVAIDHGRTERQLVQANSWPCIQENTTINDQSVAMSVVNSGIGPAKLEWLEMYYQGKLVRDPTTLLRLCCGLPAEPHQVISKYVASFDIGNPNQQVLRAGESIQILQMRGDQPPRHLIQTLGGHLNDVTFRGCYCSVFDECWTGDLNSLATRRVASCGADPSAFTVSLP